MLSTSLPHSLPAISSPVGAEDRTYQSRATRLFGAFCVAMLCLIGTMSVQAMAEPGQKVQTETDEARLEYVELQLKQRLPSLVKTNKCRAARMASNLAACEFAQEQYNDAAKHMQQALTLFTADCPQYARMVPMMRKHLGDCEAIKGKPAVAVKHYEEALAGSASVAAPMEFKQSLWKALSDVYFSTKDYAKAEEYLRLLARSQEIERDDSIGWTYMGLKDCLAKQGKPKEAEVALNCAANAFRKALETPIAPAPVLQGRRGNFTRDLWDALEPQLDKSPILAWRPGAKPWVILLCIHGMGLHKSCFAGFGKEMSKKGALVVAIDVRGFGSWRTLRKEDSLDLEDCTSDVRDIAKLLKTYNPNTKVFLVGESMGGAIALQAACGCDFIDGVISSVPAADRYNGKQTAFKVAWQVLTKPGSDFDITEDVIENTSRHKSTVDKFKNDPSVRAKLRPKELIQFDSFMKKTASVVANLERPVLITQGAADPLVKPGSTIMLFDAIKTNDKTLLLLGGAEHLIFENSQFTPILLEGVTTWLRGHLNDGDTNRSGSETGTVPAPYQKRAGN